MHPAGEDDQLHIRPYVDLPGPLPAEAPQRAPDLSPFAKVSTDETSELPVVRGRAGRGATGSHRKPRRFRGRGAAVLAVTGVAAALGAGLLTSQLLDGDGEKSDDRSLSADDQASPVDPTGGPTAQERKNDKAEKKDTGETERTAKESASPAQGEEATGHRAELKSEQRTEPTQKSQPSQRSKQGSGKTAHPERTESERGRQARELRERWQEWQRQQQRGGGQGLSVGDSGPEVVDLQRRLKQVGALDVNAPEDGTYSTQVQEAVARYQMENNVRGDRVGDYGPATKSSLESRT